MSVELQEVTPICWFLIVQDQGQRHLLVPRSRLSIGALDLGCPPIIGKRRAVPFSMDLLFTVWTWAWWKGADNCDNVSWMAVPIAGQ
jgi:hypothetical protein